LLIPIFTSFSKVSFKDPFGAITDDFSVIRQQYLYKQLGIVDIICALPFDSIALILFFLYPRPFNDSPFGFATINPYLLAWGYLRLIKLIPIFRMLKRIVFKLMSTNDTHDIRKAAQRMLCNLITILILGHVSGAVFWHIAILDGCPGSFLVNQGLVSKPFLSQYLETLYTTTGALLFSFRTPLV
jgi:hypothetical protein